MSAIHTIGLTKYYGKSRGIIDLDLEVDQGEFFGFIGPNGAGKSTTIRILTGLIKSTGGSAKIFGKDAAKEKDKILSKVGYLPSETMFYPGMKVKELIKLSAELRRKDCHAEANRLCERLNKRLFLRRNIFRMICFWKNAAFLQGKACPIGHVFPEHHPSCQPKTASLREKEPGYRIRYPQKGAQIQEHCQDHRPQCNRASHHGPSSTRAGSTPTPLPDPVLPKLPPEPSETFSVPAARSSV